MTLSISEQFGISAQFRTFPFFLLQLAPIGRYQQEVCMLASIKLSSAVLFAILLIIAAPTRADNDDGVVRVKSAYPMAETLAH
jgi:hypothetical protein